MAESADAALAIATTVCVCNYKNTDGDSSSSSTDLVMLTAMRSLLGATAKWYKRRAPVYAEALLCLQRTLPTTAGPASDSVAATRCVEWAGPLLKSRPPTAKAAAQIISRMHPFAKEMKSTDRRSGIASASASVVATIALALGRFAPKEAFAVLGDAGLDVRDMLQLIA